VSVMIEEIAALLRDDDQFLRIEAIRVLATCDSPTTRHTLRDALVDRHPLVQEAAESALAALLKRGGSLSGSPPDLPSDALSQPPTNTLPKDKTDTVAFAAIAPALLVATAPSQPAAAAT
jgi:hypothetical protein